METLTPTTEKQFRIRILADTDYQNPFKDWDCEYPLMYESGRDEADFSEGEIDRYLEDYLSYNQIVYHQKKIISMLDNGILEDELPNCDTTDEKVNLISDALSEFIRESIENKVSFCENFKVKHYNGSSTGYSQGDWANVLIVPTEGNAKKLGYNIKDVTEEQLKGTFNLFGYWAWGDVYGYIIEEKKHFKKVYDDGEEEESEEWEEIDSCWGFYGRDAEENGMIDNLDWRLFSDDKQAVINMINDVDVEYR